MQKLGINAHWGGFAFKHKKLQFALKTVGTFETKFHYNPHWRPFQAQFHQFSIFNTSHSSIVVLPHQSRHFEGASEMQEFWQRRQTLPWWKHRYIQDPNGCEVLAFNDPALHLTPVLKAEESLLSVFIQLRSMPCDVGSFPCVLLWHIRRSAPSKATRHSRSVCHGCNTHHMDILSVQLQKEVFPLNKDRALVPFRWPHVKVRQLPWLTLANTALSTFPLSLQDGEAGGPHQHSSSS